MRAFFIGGPWDRQSADLDIVPAMISAPVHSKFGIEYLDPVTNESDGFMPVFYEYRLHRLSGAHVYVNGGFDEAIRQLLECYCDHETQANPTTNSTLRITANSLKDECGSPSAGLRTAELVLREMRFVDEEKDK